ncbi:MAG: glycosyltransferase family 4 protein [Ignavibacteriaceae bacterium]|nr:glycosyltransferase family 4 protein [Ignavibacteriaceae bacterium]
MKTAIVQEWLVNYAGSEKCVESFNNIYPGADIFSLVDYLNDEERGIILKGKLVHTSFIQKLPFAKKKHRNYLPLFPMAIEQFDLSEYDLVITSSHAVAKGVLTNSNQLHICYCHTPMRYAWDLYNRYITEAGLTKGFKGLIAKSTLHYIRMWDISTANRPDYFIANSNHIARRIKKTYNRDAEVIYPPVDVDKFPLYENKDNFYLTASRMVPYKRIDLIVEAFTAMPDKKLVVIGHGPEMEKIKQKAGKNIEILGYQPDSTLVEYMQKAKAFVFAAEEDFGIIVVEAMAAGTPVIAWKRGGTGESVIDNKTGVLFSEQTTDSIIDAVKRFEKTDTSFDPKMISEYASGFDRKLFELKISSFIKNKMDEFYNNK